MGDSAAQPLNEFRLVIVGRGGVGKTALAHRLVGNEFQRYRTAGVDVMQWALQDGDRTLIAHVWSFGGDVVMHSTHRLFMSSRAVYLVLVSGREGMEDEDAEYWLSMVRSLASEVPTIVLLHNYDLAPFELNRELLRDKYGRDLVFLETDSMTGRGMEELRHEIVRQAGKLPHLSTLWPLAWRQVKDALATLEKRWLSYEDFRAFCVDHGVRDEQQQDVLGDLLHALGITISFRDDETLSHFGVLSPQWVTHAIYRILNAAQMRQTRGQFTLATVADVLPEREYPKEVHLYLLALMRKLQLCLPLDDSCETYLIPELLTKEAPPKLEEEFPAGDCFRFVYEYPNGLPPGLLPRFIAASYVLHVRGRLWRQGAVLERLGSRAVVRADARSRRVEIRVRGERDGQRPLLGMIREHFDHIHATYSGLTMTELVPIPGDPVASVNLDLLLQYERAGLDQMMVGAGSTLKAISVKELLDAADVTARETMKSAHLAEPLASREVSARSAVAASVETLLDWSIPVFVSYAREDFFYCDQMLGALTPYHRNGELSVWADPKIVPGEQWETEIFKYLDEAAIVIMLLSFDFIRSDFVMEKEVPRALEREKRGECMVVPVLVRPCRFDKTSLRMFQAIIPDGKAISEHGDKPDAAWVEFTRELDKVIDRVRAKSAAR